MHRAKGKNDCGETERDSLMSHPTTISLSPGKDRSHRTVHLARMHHNTLETGTGLLHLTYRPQQSLFSIFPASTLPMVCSEKDK